jgi:general secretion pathway protein J
MKGFTLVETLVALAALAMLATGAMAVSSASTASQDAIRAHQEATHTLMRLRAIMKADLSQAAARRARDVNGAKAQAALAGGALGDGVFLSLVRRGWDNPLEQERSSLQYVEYRLSGARLERRWRRHVDGSPLQQPQVLAEGVQSLRLEFFDFDQWMEGWAGAPNRPLPRAVRLSLDLADGGPVSQVFLLPEATVR